MADETGKNLSEAIEETVEIAEDVVRHPLTKMLARLGFYTKGILFIIIGILAILVAVGSKSGELAAPTGALTAVAQIPFGKIILIVFIGGAIGHGVWNILRGVADVDDAGGGWQGIGKRIIPVGVGIFYFILAWSAWSIIITAQISQPDEAMQKTLTAMLFTLPFGAVLVGIIGFSVICAGVNQCYSGFSGKFQENFKLRGVENSQQRIITILGLVSFTTQALIFGLIGYFFIWAAIVYNPKEAIGLDGALLKLAQSYSGKTLLFITAAGLICHGVLSIYEAKYRRIC
ncbi:MAG: DUF1206 domain-containing protein [Pyrinomonadaceae bacterium]